MDGIINVNKPSGMTSHDVVRDMRRLLGTKKIGHTGTLDPMATGVLPICIGKATRVLDYMDLDLKKYRCTMLLGITTDTQDVWGNVLSENDTENVTEQAVIDAFTGFKGVINQKPPMYSAIRVSGRRLYEYARAGETVEVKTRKIYINSLVLDEIDLKSERKRVTFTVECSKGTYIRTICQDVGQKLGCGGTMESLVRLASGSFTVEEAVDLERLKTMTPEEAADLVLSVDFPLSHFGQVLLTPEMGKRFVDGWHISLNECKFIKEPDTNGPVQDELGIRPEFKKAYNVYMSGIYGEEDQNRKIFLGVAIYSDKYKKLVCDKVFYRSE